MKLSTRLVLYISILLISLSAIFGYISIRDERHHLMAETKQRAWMLSRTFAATFKYYHFENQRQRLEELVHSVAPHEGEEGHLLLNVYDRFGRLVNISYKHGVIQQPAVKMMEMDSLEDKGSEGIVTLGADRFLSVTNPIKNSAGEVQGAVEVLLSLDHIGVVLSGIIKKFVLFTILTAILISTAIYLISFWSVSKPIRKLIEASRKLGLGDLGLRIDKSSIEELDGLIESFNRMSENLEKKNKEREDFFAEKLQLERGLRHSDKLASIGQLTGGLAHEIGTPLNVISGRAEHLLKNLPKDHSGRSNLHIILRQSDRIVKMMQQMLTFSRKPAARFSVVDLEKIIREAFSLCQLRQRKMHPQIHLEVDLSINDLIADEDGIRQLFVNLMLNSFHALQDGGVIKVKSESGRHDTGEIILTYEDNGPGIPPGQQERIFDPFFTTKDVGEGTGLGLFMAANIVQEHQGRIELDNNFDQGARFVLSFPLLPGNNHGVT